MDEDTFWLLIEEAWLEAAPSLCRAREALRLERSRSGRALLARHLETALPDVLDALSERLVALSPSGLLSYDRTLERLLHRLDRVEVYAAMRGDPDQFARRRGFVIALGRDYFQAVDRDPRRVDTCAECRDMTYLPFHLLVDIHGPSAWTPSAISRESGTNPEGWTLVELTPCRHV